MDILKNDYFTSSDPHHDISYVVVVILPTCTSQMMARLMALLYHTHRSSMAHLASPGSGSEINVLLTSVSVIRAHCDRELVVEVR